MIQFGRVGSVLSLVAALGVAGCAAKAPTIDAVREATRVRGAETVAVNRYLWGASLDVLNFMPVENVDPFTGVISFGYGVPSGGKTAYRGIVYISGPALDARGLNVSLSTKFGPVSQETLREVEAAILTRARQLRVGGAL